VHIILDNYGTHKSPLIRSGLAKRPRFHLHFTPTRASWLNSVERWFAPLTAAPGLAGRGMIRSAPLGPALAIGASPMAHRMGA
jgi:hypothetical protein